MRVRCVRRIDPCTEGNPTPGTLCRDGTYFAGSLTVGAVTYKYKTTPGNCTNSSTPTCNNTKDTLSLAWATGATASTATTATSQNDGWGNSVTLATFSDTTAAKYCRGMTYAGTSDWFLPAQFEIYLLYTNRASFASLDLTTLYWSSTQDNMYLGYPLRFTDGLFPGTPKTTTALVRCFRKF